MFDFEKLDVYRKAKVFNSGLREFIRNTKLDTTTRDQLRRAGFSVVLNLAEGSGRFTHPDRRNFYIIARSSVFECVAILDVLKDESIIEEEIFRRFYNLGEELSKILFKMIKNLQWQSEGECESEWRFLPIFLHSHPHPHTFHPSKFKTVQLFGKNQLLYWKEKIRLKTSSQNLF